MRRQQPPRPITGRMVFFMMVAFFGVVIGVNLIMMRLAIQTASLDVVMVYGGPKLRSVAQPVGGALRWLLGIAGAAAVGRSNLSSHLRV